MLYAFALIQMFHGFTVIEILQILFMLNARKKISKISEFAHSISELKDAFKQAWYCMLMREIRYEEEIVMYRNTFILLSISFICEIIAAVAIFLSNKNVEGIIFLASAFLFLSVAFVYRIRKLSKNAEV